MAFATTPAESPLDRDVPVLAELDFVPVSTPPRGWVSRQLSRVRLVAGWLFGLASLLLGLAVLAAVPIVQFLTLGYLLEASGRVARSGRLRDGFIGVRTAAHFGGVAIGCFLLWLPLFGISYFGDSARIIDPHGRIARQLEMGLTVLAVIYALHVTGACLRGGRLRTFFWPLNVVWLLRRAFRVNVVREARDRLWYVVTALHLPHYFWLGVRGFAGAFLWLVVPLFLLGQGHRAVAAGVLGGILLALVVLYLPFLQTRFARDGRFRAFFELRAVRTDLRRAPLALALALVVHLLFAIPLYVLKIELIPRDLVFLEGLVFLAFIFPARLLDGWAYSRPARREQPGHWIFRWLARLVMLSAVSAYAGVVFLSQHLSWHGVPSLYEQHAFLLPVPFTKWNG